MQKICEKCGQSISAQNFSRHVKRCDGTGIKKYIKQEYTSLICKFCDKEYKSLNSLRQHECRCPSNPNRKAFNNLTGHAISRKGQTATTNEVIRKQVETMKRKYANGFICPSKGRKKDFVYIYQEHNDQEIQKWLNYVNRSHVEIPNYEILEKDHPEGYKVIKTSCKKTGNTVKIIFEHELIANIYLHGNLRKENTVHHINKDRKDNKISNLLIFINGKAHKRFHNSKYAFLIYDESTHLFDCILNKNTSN